MTRQNAPASGVRTGLPSNSTVVQPLISGPYTIYECPTTQPTSDAAQNTSPGFVLYTVFIEYFSATAWPPLSRTTPFGLPVVPLV